MNITPLRLGILLLIPIDATPAELDTAHDTIDCIAAGGTALDPQYLVNTPVPAIVDGQTATGTVALVPEVDSDGVPWDERIHSGVKSRTAKGAWTRRRNVDDTTFAKISAELKASVAGNAKGAWTRRRNVDDTTFAKISDELKASVAGNATPAANLPPPPGTNPLPLPATNLPPPPGTNPLPLPGTNLPPPPPGTAVVDPAYTALVKLIADNTQSATNPAGRLTDAWVTQVLAAYSVPEGNLQNLAHMPAQVPVIHQYIAQALAA